MNYPIHDKEILSIVACLKEWRAESHSVNKPFTILTDHKTLSFLTTKRLLNERQIRYNELLSEFQFVLRWRPGVVSDRPDALSRREQDKPIDTDDERTAGRIAQLLLQIEALPAIFNINHFQVEDPADEADLFENEEIHNLWKQAVKSDADWRRAMDAVRVGERSFPPDLSYKLSANIAECTVAADNVLRGRENRIWIPDHEPLRTAIMQNVHDSYLGGHPGKDTMIGILLRCVFWPKMRETVRRFIRNCNVCGRTTVWREAKAGFVRSLPIPDRLRSELTIDFVTDLPLSQGCTNVMVLTNRLSKDMFLFGTKSMEAEQCAKIFLDKYYRYNGFPRYLTSDRGSDWLSHFWEVFCQFANITQRLTTAYHPQSNASEKVNQEIYKYLRAYICYTQDDWMELLPLAKLTLNTRPNSAIGGMSPFILRHGYNLDVLSEPTPQICKSKHRGTVKTQNYVQRLKDAQEFAQAAMASAQQLSEENANRIRRQSERFKVSDRVWLNLKHIKTPQLSKKLAWQHAKYEVIAVPDALNVELNVPGNIHKRFHVMLFKRTGTDPFPSQVRDDAQNPPVLDDLGVPEYEVESILRAKTVRRGRGKFRQALVKLVSEIDPSREPVEYIEDTFALDRFESLYGPIATNDGPPETFAGKYIGPAEEHVSKMRRQRRQLKINKTST